MGNTIADSTPPPLGSGRKNDCWVSHNVSFFKWPGGPGQVFNAVSYYITIPNQTQLKTSWDLPLYIHHFFSSLFPCGVKYSEWWTLSLARLMCLRENYSNFPLKRTGWIHSKVAYSLPVWVPPSNIGEIPCVYGSLWPQLGSRKTKCCLEQEKSTLTM